MEFNVIAAVIAGLAGTTIMTGMMLMVGKTGMPAIDVHGLLGYVTQVDRPNSVGYIFHWVFGAVSAIVYALLFQVVPGNILILGAVFGFVHWLIIGGVFAFVPKVHAGMKAGQVQESGAYMLKALGIMGFIGGAMGHVVFGVTVGLVYGLIIGSFGG